MGLVPYLCIHNVYKLFARELALNQLPPWVDVKPKVFRGEKAQDEKCVQEETKRVNETTIEEHPDCYERINDTEIFFEKLHLWLDGLLVPFTGRIFLFP